MPAAAATLPPDLQACGVNITPNCLRALYNIPIATLNNSVNTLGIYEAGDVYAQADLDLFFAQFAPNVPQGSHPALASIE
jgi:tripeptidyl-peptidase-1